jgi:hypothetical protein
MADSTGSPPSTIAILDDVESALEALLQSGIPALIDVLQNHRDWHDKHPNVVHQTPHVPPYMLQKALNVRRDVAQLACRVALKRCDRVDRLSLRMSTRLEEEGPVICRVALSCDACLTAGPDIVRHRRLEDVYFMIPDGWVLWAHEGGVLRASCPKCGVSHVPHVPGRGPYRTEMSLPLP